MKKQIFFMVLSLLVTLFIFGNSLQTAEKSGEASGFLVDIISKIFTRIGCDINPFTATYFVRKTAHLLEFALQGFLICGCFSCEFKKRAIYVLILGFITACTDEFIQLFSSGRAAMIQDVFLDFTGCILGILFFMIARKFVPKLN